MLENMLAREALLGFDARVPVGGDLSHWSSDRRRMMLYRQDVEKLQSVDVMVWPSLFDTGEGKYMEPEARAALQLGDIPLDKWTGPNHGIWSDLSELRSALPERREHWIIAISVVLGRKVNGPLGPYVAPTTPSEIDPSWLFLGWDVADGFRLSGLTNCGRSPSMPQRAVDRWSPPLNQHHLFREPGDALAFKKRCDRSIREHKPFFVYGIRRIGELGSP